MTLASHYKAQGKWDQLDLGGYIEHNRQLSGGIWYRGLPVAKAYQQGYSNSEAVILMAGVLEDDQLRFTYSYDITISKLTMKSAGAHEISLIYEWPRRRRSTARHKVVPLSEVHKDASRKHRTHIRSGTPMPRHHIAFFVTVATRRAQYQTESRVVEDPPPSSPARSGRSCCRPSPVRRCGWRSRKDPAW
jgi:hypothetical protein